MENHYTQIIEYAPIIIVILMFIWQNNVFVRPEQLEKKHREIIDDIENRFSCKFVEMNAYKEFQNHIYSKLDELTEAINDLKASLMKRRKDDE